MDGSVLKPTPAKSAARSLNSAVPLLSKVLKPSRSFVFFRHPTNILENLRHRNSIKNSIAFSHMIVGSSPIICPKGPPWALPQCASRDRWPSIYQFRMPPQTGFFRPTSSAAKQLFLRLTCPSGVEYSGVTGPLGIPIFDQWSWI